MSPRPQKASDDEILAAAYRVMQRLGPHELTLAEIAAEAGVTAGALVQRFGSKRALLLRLAEAAAAGAGDLVRELRRTHRTPLRALRAYADCMAQLAASPEAMARNLSYLTIDLGDEAFRRHLQVNARGTRAALEELVADAVNAGELRSTVDARRLARSIETMVGGSLFTWATYQEGSATNWLRQDLEAILAPYVVRKPTRSRRVIR